MKRYGVPYMGSKNHGKTVFAQTVFEPECGIYGFAFVCRCLTNRVE